ncbi:hypothetical protein ABIE78_001318 [Sinorhizobium fredii]
MRRAYLNRQFAAPATRRPADSVALTVFAVSCPMPRIVLAQELRVVKATRMAPIVARVFVVMTMIPSCCCKDE